MQIKTNVKNYSFCYGKTEEKVWWWSKRGVKAREKWNEAPFLLLLINFFLNNYKTYKHYTN